MSHDNQLSILISTDTVFHFIHTDGDGKMHHSPHYQTDNMDAVYRWQQRICNLWITRDQLKRFRTHVRKQARATRI